MSIQDYAKQMYDIEVELRRIRVRLRELNQQKRQVEGYIQHFLEDNNHPGFRYRGMMFVPKVVKRRERLSQSAKSERIRDLLQSLGISADPQLVRDFIESTRGDVNIGSKIEIVGE